MVFTGKLQLGENKNNGEYQRTVIRNNNKVSTN